MCKLRVGKERRVRADNLKKMLTCQDFSWEKNKNHCFLTPNPSPPFSLNYLFLLSLISQMALKIISPTTKLPLWFIRSLIKYCLLCAKYHPKCEATVMNKMQPLASWMHDPDEGERQHNIFADSEKCPEENRAWLSDTTLGYIIYYQFCKKKFHTLIFLKASHLLELVHSWDNWQHFFLF